MGKIKLEVLNPSGESRHWMKNSPRLNTLNGKTVCEILHASPHVNGFRGGDTFPVIRGLLKQRYPDIKIVPYTEFPQGTHGLTFPYWLPVEEIPGVLKSKGCDAVIVGNGG